MTYARWVYWGAPGLWEACNVSGPPHADGCVGEHRAGAGTFIALVNAIAHVEQGNPFELKRDPARTPASEKS